MAIYSTKYKKVEDIPAGATIGIPNDPSNGARALLVLADKGFIEVKDKNDVSTSIASITKKSEKTTRFKSWTLLLFLKQWATLILP